MANKFVRGSFIIFIGNMIFRIGGYVYRFLMAALLGPSMYGVLSITLPYQGIFQSLSAGGLPPAIAKFVAEHNALNESDMARQTIYTALKIMIFLGVFLGALMVLFVAPWLAYDYLGKPETLVPLQIVGLITPFSVIVGAFRGAFQGVYKMEYIVYTRAVEQLAMILLATAFILMGLSVAGALWGTVLGFAFSAVAAIYIFKKHMCKYIPPASDDFVFTVRDELKLASKLVRFSIPVIITSIAEMIIYNICTLVMGRFLTTDDVGYFSAADPIARLPLMIPVAIATTILPAASEAFAAKKRESLQKYISQAYTLSLLFVVPMCLGIALFSTSILRVCYFTDVEYTLGAGALSVLVVGMTFYSIYTVSTSIVQGIGNPRIPMYILVFGAILAFALNWYMVPIYGIVGGSFATTLACFVMMVPILYLVFKLTKTKPPVKRISKILLASVLLVIVALIIPDTPVGLVCGIILCPIAYFAGLLVCKFFTVDDVEAFRSFSSKLGPLSGILNKIINFIEKRAE